MGGRQSVNKYVGDKYKKKYERNNIVYENT